MTFTRPSITSSPVAIGHPTDVAWVPPQTSRRNLVAREGSAWPLIEDGEVNPRSLRREFLSRDEREAAAPVAVLRLRRVSVETILVWTGRPLSRWTSRPPSGRTSARGDPLHVNRASPGSG